VLALRELAGLFPAVQLSSRHGARRGGKKHLRACRGVCGGGHLARKSADRQVMAVRRETDAAGTEARHEARRHKTHGSVQGGGEEQRRHFRFEPVHGSCAGTSVTFTEVKDTPILNS
jgi:hypothetical protein